MDVSMFLVQQTKVVKREEAEVLIAGVQRPISLHILGESSRICLKAPSIMILGRSSQCLEKVPTFGPLFVESDY